MVAPHTDARFQIVAGKGGVGKSTVCATLGLLSARAGRKTIIAELNTREKASVFFGKPPSGYTPQRLADNLYSINIQPEPALREYGLMKLRFERVYKMVFENEAIKRLIKMIPGMTELFLLGKAFNLERERNRDGSPTWDTIIVDAPATGHGVSLLRLPQVILQVAKTGPMAEEVELMRGLLEDPDRTRLHLVSLAEDMPVRETVELAKQNAEILRIPTGHLFINAIWPDAAVPAALGSRSSSAATPASSPLVTLASKLDDTVSAQSLRCLDRFDARHQLQQKYIEELDREILLPSVQMPFLFRDSFDEAAIAELADIIAPSL